MMISKVIYIAAIVTVTAARPQDGFHGHGSAFSSQSIQIHTQGHDDHHHYDDHGHNFKPHHGHDELVHYENKIGHPAHHEKYGNEHRESDRDDHWHDRHHEHNPGHHESLPWSMDHHKSKHHDYYDFSEAPVHRDGSNFHHHEPEMKSHHEHHHDDDYARPKYSIDYEVKDPHTGDYKSRHEVRDGDVVYGFYSLNEADGTTRIVEYTADKTNGFTAKVKHEGTPMKMEIKHH